MKRSTRKRWFYQLWMLVIALTLVLPAPTSIAANELHTSVKSNVVQNLSNKVNSTVMKSFEDQEYVTFLVKMKEQADPQTAAQQAEKNAASKNATAASKKYMKRSAVVSALRGKSIETQRNIKGFLQKEKKNGKVKDFQSFYIVNGLAVTATKEVMEEIAAFAEVEKILPNETRQLIQPAVEKQNQINAETQSIEWNIEQIGAPAVWDMGIDGTGVVVASIDTGVQWDHPALIEKYRGYDPNNPTSPNHEYNWFDATAGGSVPYDDQGHGTHVTGTMVGSEPNGSNQIGVAPGAKWIAVKAFTAAGGTDVDLLEAGEWILAPKDAAGNPHPEMAPDVVNNSWGGGSGMDEWYRPMVQAWRAAEIFPEFSAGNTTLFNPGGPGSIATPANYPESFATGATDSQNRLASFSLEGPSPYDEIKPDISAPGVNIRSSVPGGAYEGGWNGTSMAGPHVSAVVALLKQVNANLTVDEIEEILMNTAIPLTDGEYPESPNNGYGAGLVNAYDAVSSVINGLGTVKGNVTKDGDDDTAPTLEHQGPNEVFTGMDVTLHAEASDDVSVTNVLVRYQNQDGSIVEIEASRISGDYKSGTYEATIPGEDIAEPSLQYEIVALDFGSNESTSGSIEVPVLPGITVGYEQDFESTPSGWTSYGDNNTWEWGTPISGPGGAFSGENVYATNLEGNYDNRANMNLVMPPIDLPDGSSYLQFKQWHNLERNYDYGHVFVSTDQENWVQKLRVNNVTDGWVDGEVDLSEYAGQRIYVAFNVTTDGSVLREGWYIDDVKLTDTPINTSSQKGKVGNGQDKGQLGITDSSSAKKENVNPNKIVPAVKIEKEPVKDTPEKITPLALPMSATVTVVESGRSTQTNPQDGSFKMVHAAGTFTLAAEAYGYRTETQVVDIPADGEIIANFTLEELPQGTVSGSVINDQTGLPVEGATLYLVEDAAVAPVATDENGNFTIEAYEGTYTLKVSAPSYYSEEVKITIDSENPVDLSLSLRPFIGYPGEIGYDDGTAENARAFYDAGNGWAVKMTLENGQSQAILNGALFRFWDTSWPTPGGTDFDVEVYDATGVDGAPGQKLAGPIDANALRNGQWTQVDLSEHGIVVPSEFYVVYIQTEANPYAPGLGTDEDGQNAGRSWQLVGGGWSPSPEDEGNYMIRALVDYEVTAPTITSPIANSFTNEQDVVVEGTTAADYTVHLYNNGEEVAVVQSDNEGRFQGTVTLSEGANSLTAKAASDNGMTDASETVVVTYDATLPTLSIDSPEDELKTNREVITVSGSVDDEYLDTVTVNGQQANVTEGSYSHRILLNEGENEIVVVAKDMAGNTTTSTITVDAKFGIDDMTGLTPTEDKELKSGESVQIEFYSEPGLDATFVIHMPLTNVTNATELPMMEMEDGRYVGYYTATSNVKADGALIEVIARDDYGNEVRKAAEGKLYINAKKKNK
ncbi:bacillopeptidase F [Bacillus carboniphilus]|uniref:Bacillopeptidase F n=1 Tax=Bacillus carboniphilus TaxID=86663 RepID=A0ABN0W950_9BACI